ncbi:hypothetical protein BDN67DRAFT_910220, partial [Paxillus ammoniavirescens]
FYQHYNKFLPTNLTCLLQLWDHLGISHEEWKQIFGPELPIIGFNVDPNVMRVQMSNDSRLKLVEDLHEFGQHGTRRALKDFQKIGGYLCWS